MHQSYLTGGMKSTFAIRSKFILKKDILLKTKLDFETELSIFVIPLEFCSITNVTQLIWINRCDKCVL